ncbi:hypothetical protein KUTeg_003483 [Tegillarca granosa]|uniref:Uncharacterized protein n=1 Tax=Tegillarca granosa TaxID=220873 RepID=A0ABQ9FP41_TEGGR|nr:hypothetical protein KUTeg_003483 [Tegillarca granosa]
MDKLQVLFCFIWIVFDTDGSVFARYLDKNADISPCEEPESGVVFPFISDSEGHHLSTLEDYLQHLNLNGRYNNYPDQLIVSFTWHNKTITLLLKQNLINGEESVTEWTEDDITYAEFIDEKCYYQDEANSFKNKRFKRQAPSGEKKFLEVMIAVDTSVIKLVGEKKVKNGTRFDVAVFFTRTGIGPAGYAPITGLCNPTRSCAVVKDEGFTSAFIVAHEIAHVIGLMHDGHGNTCSGREYQTAVMAPMIQATLNHFWWSSCSRERMQQLIPTLSCINNNPLEKEAIEVQEPYGKHWDIDEQCKYEFGPEHRACRAYHGDLCEMLWCNTKRNPRSCKTKRGRPLNGTSCGNERWCMGGACTYYGGQPPRDGGFGEWSKWSACAEDCGFSIKTRTRKCDNPRPAYGGKNCEGDYQEVDSCKAEQCKLYTDKREFQCTLLDVLPVRDRRNTWLPYQLNDESKRCKLTCISNETKEIATVDDIPVDDGTPCSYEHPNHICVKGECWEIGCDGVRNSTKQFDECGICDGDGSKCKVVQGRFTKRMKYSGRDRNYHEVTMIPAGARNIEIRETATSAHFIAVLDPAYGTFAIGGNKRQSHSKKFSLNGAWFNYENSWNFETLTSDGPLQRKIQIMIFPQNAVYKAALGYKYTVKADDNTYEKELYEWKYQGWTDCSVTCGTGTQSLIYKCFDKNSDTETDNERCSLLEDPTGDPVECKRVQCNADLKNNSFLFLKSIIYEYIRRSEYKPKKDTHLYLAKIDISRINNESEISIKGALLKITLQLLQNLYSSRLLSVSILKTPIKLKTIRLQKQIVLIYRWVMSVDWSDCTATCGEEGVQYQLYSCERETQDGEIEPVSMEMCSSLETPEYSRECNRVECKELEYKWIMSSDWSDCSRTCGGGIKTQAYSCGKDTSDGAIEVVEIDLCDHLPKPNITRVCNQNICEEYQWVMLDEWDACSETCGNNGIETQMFFCGKIAPDDDVESVEFEKCSDQKAPNITRSCNRISCIKYQWIKSDEWSDCTASCGDSGQQNALYKCMAVTTTGSSFVDPELCDEKDKPVSTRDCNRFPCFHYTFIDSLNWTECSITCGDDGIQQKIFHCLNESINGQKIHVDLAFCSDLDTYTPNVTRACKRQPCDRFEWMPTDEWSSCTMTCGDDGVQYQRHVCTVIKLNGVSETISEDYCSETPKPEVERECNREPCLLEWSVGGWSECSVTCGIGLQWREVTCGNLDSDHGRSRCPGDPPSLSEVCKRKDCPASSDTCKDRISICKRNASPRKCQYRGYKSMCCATCRDLHDIAPNDSWYRYRRFL